MRTWDLDDLAGVSELAEEHGVVRAAVVNWRRRHADFPEPLIVLSTGPVFSRRQVCAWQATRPERNLRIRDAMTATKE